MHSHITPLYRLTCTKLALLQIYLGVFSSVFLRIVFLEKSFSTFCTHQLQLLASHALSFKTFLPGFLDTSFSSTSFESISFFTFSSFLLISSSKISFDSFSVPSLPSSSYFPLTYPSRQSQQDFRHLLLSEDLS